MTTVTNAEVRLLELPLVEPFVASHGTTTSRTLAVIKISDGRHSGWGECSALPAATYSSESANGAFDSLVERILPELIGRGLLPLASPGQPMAQSAVEMAILDLELKTAGRSLANRIGAKRRTVPAGVSIGLDQLEATAEKVGEFTEAGFRRVKLKVQPGHDTQLVEAVRGRSDHVQIQIDANGAYGPDQVEYLAELAKRFNVEAIEQPFAADDTDSAAKLVGLVSPCGIHVVADEAVESIDDVRRLHQLCALTAVSIKPARLGGVLTAVAIHDLCHELGLAATAGGMLESGLGRHALAAVAGLPHFSLTGDVSPAQRWVTKDPWSDLELTNGEITVPTTPGIAPAPIEATVEELTIRHETIA